MKNAWVAYLMTTSLLASAQSWCPPGAVWKYEGLPIPGQCIAAQYVLVFSGDTVVDGQQAQRIDRFTQALWQGTLIEYPAISGFTRTNGDVVWEWYGNTWDTLYWFSAVPGDQWQPAMLEAVCPEHRWHVLDTSTVVVGGVPLRAVEAEIRENNVPIGYPSRTFIERLGGGGGYLFPDTPPCAEVIECVSSLVCYQDDEIAASAPCELTLDIDPVPIRSAARIWPNPGSEALHVEWSGGLIDELEVRDALGRSVLKRTSILNNNAIDVSALAPGTYVVLARTAQGERVAANWVKQ
jgi:hypothetical protein